MSELEPECLGCLPDGSHLFYRPNSGGGYSYFSDECGAMGLVWNTAITPEATLLAAMLAEKHRQYSQNRPKGPEWPNRTERP